VTPGAINVVPAEAAASLELRAPLEPALHRLAEIILDEARGIAAAEKVELEVDSGARIAPVAMDERVSHAAESACRRLEIAFRRLHSGAGHDAQSMSTLCPAGMIFVPSAGGISHAPEEFTPWDQIEAGLRVLAESIQHLDQGVGSEK
jgi:N-carbamoyl-L-amino-acid hydrolase